MWSALAEFSGGLLGGRRYRFGSHRALHGIKSSPLAKVPAPPVAKAAAPKTLLPHSI